LLKQLKPQTMHEKIIAKYHIIFQTTSYWHISNFVINLTQQPWKGFNNCTLSLHKQKVIKSP